MRYGFKTRNDQKGSKMAAKSKMAAENYNFIIFSTNIPMLGLFMYFWVGISFLTVFFLNKSMLKAQDGDQIQDGHDI